MRMERLNQTLSSSCFSLNRVYTIQIWPQFSSPRQVFEIRDKITMSLPTRGARLSATLDECEQSQPEGYRSRHFQKCLHKICNALVVQPDFLRMLISNTQWELAREVASEMMTHSSTSIPRWFNIISLKWHGNNIDSTSECPMWTLFRITQNVYTLEHEGWLLVCI